MSKSVKARRIKGGKITTTVVCVLMCVMLGAVGAYGQSYQSLYPLLVDLSGWNGAEPEGMNMEMPGMKMVNAVRAYQRGKREFTAMIVIGNTAMAGYTSPQGMMNMETDEAKVVVKMIRGFQVTTVYDKKDRSGAVSVMLLPGEKGGAVFTLSFEEMSSEQALNLAEKFDWKVMQEKVKSF